MATTQEQPEQQQQPPQQQQHPASPPAPKSSLAMLRGTLRANVASSGKRIVVTQTVSLVGTMALGLFCWWAYWETEVACTGGPVGLRSWYLGAFVLEFAVSFLFFGILYSVVSVWSKQAAAMAAAAAAGTPSAAPQAAEVEEGEGSCAVGLAFVLALITFLVVLWSFLGLASTRDAGGCESGNDFFWYIFVVMWLSVVCCTGGSAVDTYRQRRAGQSAEAQAAAEPALEVSV